LPGRRHHHPRGAELPRDPGEGRREAAERAVNEHALTRRQAGHVGEHEVGHRRVRHDGGGDGRVDVVALGRHHQRLGGHVDRRVSARPVGRERDHPLADGEAGHPAPELAHRPRDLKAGNERRLRQARPVLVQPLTQEDVDQPDGGVADVDRDLARARSRIR
jgi:hypothetical protein